jgi:hypothetical protein
MGGWSIYQALTTGTQRLAKVHAILGIRPTADRAGHVDSHDLRDRRVSGKVSVDG